MTDDPFTPTGPSTRQLREFAALWLLVFGGVGVWRAATEGFTVWALAALVVAPAGAVGLVHPNVLRPVFVAWMWAARPIAWVVQNLALAIIYYLVFIPVGLVHRLIGRDALLLRRQPAEASLWVIVPPRDDPQSYTRQS
jgi:Saxitoxin biosynthesis operon protein SxtJ